MTVPALLGHCAKKSPPGTETQQIPKVFTSLTEEFDRFGRPGLQVFPGAGEFLSEKTGRIPMRLDHPKGGPIEAGSAKIYVGSGTSPTGPVEMTYREFASEEKHVHESGATHGFYDVEVPIPKPGVVDLAVLLESEKGDFYGFAVLEAAAEPVVPAPGQPAVSTRTPTTADPSGVGFLCTRDPVCPHHGVSLDQALQEGVPVVFVISSPRLCTSGVCGPVLEEVIGVSEQSPGVRFVHLEPYRTEEPTVLSEPALAWRLRSEPWTFIIGKDGNVAHRFEGPVTAAVLKDALTTVL